MKGEHERDLTFGARHAAAEERHLSQNPLMARVPKIFPVRMIRPSNDPCLRVTFVVNPPNFWHKGPLSVFLILDCLARFVFTKHEIW